MALARLAIRQIQKRMPKVISPKTHGVIDYAHSAIFLIAGLLFWKSNRRAALASLATGGLILAESLLTDYPLGASPVISFERHGEIDRALIPLTLAAPRMLGFASEPEAWFFRANGIAESVVVGLTNFGGAPASDEPGAGSLVQTVRNVVGREVA